MNGVMSSLTLPRWFGRIRKKKKKIPSNDTDETDFQKFQGQGLPNSRSLPATPAKNPVMVLQAESFKQRNINQFFPQSENEITIPNIKNIFGLFQDGNFLEFHLSSIHLDTL